MRRKDGYSERGNEEEWQRTGSEFEGGRVRDVLHVVALGGSKHAAVGEGDGREGTAGGHYSTPVGPAVCLEKGGERGGGVMCFRLYHALSNIVGGDKNSYCCHTSNIQCATHMNNHNLFLLCIYHIHPVTNTHV